MSRSKIRDPKLKAILVVNSQSNEVSAFRIGNTGKLKNATPETFQVQLSNSFGNEMNPDHCIDSEKALWSTLFGNDLSRCAVTMEDFLSVMEARTKLESVF
jgi:hypothetical protein